MFLKRNLTGIDIGSYSVKVVSLKGTPGSYTLSSAVSLKLPDDSDPEFISRLLRVERLSNKKAATAVTGPELILRHMRLPGMPDKDLKEAVKWELRKEISLSAGELVTDYIKTGHGDTKDSGLSIIAFGVKKGAADRIISIFSSASVDLRVIDVVPAALYASFETNNTWGDGVNYAMLDIGHSGSYLAILKDRRLVFAREIGFGGKALTDSIASGLGKDRDTAEAMKLDYGLYSEGELKSVISSGIEGLCVDLHRSFDYYQAQFREGPVSKLFLSGGTARLKGIEAYVTESTGIPAFVYDPLRRVKVPGSLENEDLRVISPSLAVAAGLATRRY